MPANLKKNLFSFDVFDTTVTRRVAVPRDVFRIVEEKLATSQSLVHWSTGFAKARETAEKTLWRRHKRCVYTLGDIYQVLSEQIGYPDHASQQIQSLEFETELSLLLPIPEIKSQISQLEESSETVVFTTDTYLTTREIKRILHHTIGWNDSYEVFSSSEYRAAKSTGDLFAAVERRFPAETYTYHHTGNDIAADVRVPRSRGWHATFFASGNLTSQELAACNSRTPAAPPTLPSLLAAQSRLTRLARNTASPCSSRRLRTIRAIAAGVAAPFIASFAGWLHEQIAKTDVRRLYFLSRDGHAVKIFYDKLAEMISSNSPPSFYLRVSRRVLQAATFDASDQQCPNWVIAERSRLTPRRLMRRLGLDWTASADRNLLRPKLPNRPDSLLPRAWIDEFRQQYRDCPLLRTTVQERFRGIKDRCEGYLSQCGFFKTEKIALVDIGWNGNMQKHLATLANSKKITGYYIGLNKATPPDGPYGDYRAFLFDRRTASAAETRPWLTGPGSPQVLETFCCEPTGTTTDYFQTTDGAYHPVVCQSQQSGLTAWGASEIFDTYESFANGLKEANQHPSFLANKSLAHSILQRFVCSPTLDEARTWGSYPFESDSSETATAVLAERARVSCTQDVLKLAAGQIPYANEVYWPAACRLLSNSAFFHLANAWSKALQPLRALNRNR